MKYSNNNKIPEDFEKKKLESSYGIHLTSLIAQLVKNLPTVWESWVQSLGWGDPLEKKKLPATVFWPGEFHGLYRP